MKDIVIDGERFVRARDSGPIKIVVLDRGFIYVGRVEEDDASITIRGARCLIRWGTEKHLGQLVDGPCEATSLGDGCTVQCRVERVIHTIEVSQNAWTDYIVV